MKKMTIKEILDELNFSDKEKEGFIKCINYVKDEQKIDDYNPEEDIKKTIEEVVENEI